MRAARRSGSPVDPGAGGRSVRVPYLDLTRLHKSLFAELTSAFEETLERSDFVGGQAVAAFERAFAAAHGQADAASCGSGTDALVLTLRALGIGPGDEVVVPAMTFFATAEAVCRVGADPVIADVDPVSLLLTPTTVAEVQSLRTRAVIPVHLHGHVVPSDHLEAWRDAGFRVIEDAAQAHLATRDGRSVGLVGDAACFSFFPGKNLGALGDGGMVLSNDPLVLDQVRILRDHGRTGKHLHVESGYCSRLDSLQARFLSIKLAHLPEWTARRSEIAECYRDRLGGLDVIDLVPWDDGAVHHHVVIRSPARDELAAGLAQRGIGTALHYPIALSDQPALAAWRRDCPAAERAGREVLSLPVDPLMSLEETHYVCDSLIAELADLEQPT